MNDTLEHHGILGMKWGVRRYQNKDGTWTKEGKEHRLSDGDTEANSARYSKYSVHSNDPQYRDKVDPVLYNNITTNHPEEVKQYAEVNKEYYDYVKEKTPEIIVDYVNSIYGGKATAENFDDELQNDWDHSDVEAYLGSNANDAQYKELKEKWLSSLRQMYKLISDETDKYLGDNSDVKEYDMSSKIEDQMLKDRNGKTQWEMAVEINDLMKEAMYNEYKRLTGEDDETHHSDDSSEEDSLMHYGILGMKWGIRRYQNSDGSLTAAGRKRYGDDSPDGDKSSSGNSSNATPRTPAKSASEMTDQELNQALNRLRMEQQYNELTGAKSSNQYQNQQNFSTPPSNTGNLTNAELQAYITRLDMEKRYAQLTAPPPKQLTNGQKFLKEVIPAVAMEVGRELVKNTMKKMLGLSGDNNENKNNNNNNNNNNKNKNENNNDALNKLRGRLDESDKRMNLIKNSIESLDKNMKTLSNKSNEDRKQTESIQKDFLDFMKKNAQQIQQEEKKNNDTLRAEWKSNAGSQKSNWSYSSGSDDYSYYENPWTYRVNRA